MGCELRSAQLIVDNFFCINGLSDSEVSISEYVCECVCKCVCMRFQLVGPL